MTKVLFGTTTELDAVEGEIARTDDEMRDLLERRVQIVRAHGHSVAGIVARFPSLHGRAADIAAASTPAT